MEHSTSAVNWQPRNIAEAPGRACCATRLQHVARGADGALFFQWRASRAGAEKFHSAMLPHAGTDTKVWREVVELGPILSSLAEVADSAVVVRRSTSRSSSTRTPGGRAELDSHPSVDLDCIAETRRWHEAALPGRASPPTSAASTDDLARLQARDRARCSTCERCRRGQHRRVRPRGRPARGDLLLRHRRRERPHPPRRLPRRLPRSCSACGWRSSSRCRAARAIRLERLRQPAPCCSELGRADRRRGPRAVVHRGPGRGVARRSPRNAAGAGAAYYVGTRLAPEGAGRTARVGGADAGVANRSSGRRRRRNRAAQQRTIAAGRS